MKKDGEDRQGAGATPCMAPVERGRRDRQFSDLTTRTRRFRSAKTADHPSKSRSERAFDRM